MQEIPKDYRCKNEPNVLLKYIDIEQGIFDISIEQDTFDISIEKDIFELALDRISLMLALDRIFDEPVVARP